ncbi:MAG: hypothetical protein KC729_18670, partial [Candidatus Eisenbacteria bacterium]|nr:hypothetical protein [Candidatus Eisenbacteria bacterium]
MQLPVAALLGLVLMSAGCGSSDNGKATTTEQSGAPAMEKPAAAATQAAPHFQIQIGSEGTVATSPDLNVEALRAGDTEFTIQHGDASYQVQLSADQVADLLHGSTVM